MTTTPSARDSGVSVVLCTYNGERYLQHQLDSLLNQTRVPDEIVVFDDASSDTTWDILERFSELARKAGIRVMLRRNASNLGYVRNFEAAIRAAQMPLVFLCDQDDVWRRDKIARMEEVFRARPALLLLHTDARLVDANGQDMVCRLFEALEITGGELALIHQGRAFDVLLRQNVVTGATAAFRQDVIDAALPFPDMWIHDEWLAMVCAIKGEIDCIEEELIDYRQHGGNQIGVRKRTLIEKFGSDRPARRTYLRLVEARLRQLSALLRESVDGTELKHDVLSQRVDHAHARANLPSAPLARLRWVFAEARTGRYHRYSFGLRSIVADVLGLD